VTTGGGAMQDVLAARFAHLRDGLARDGLPVAARASSPYDEPQSFRE